MSEVLKLIGIELPAVEVGGVAATTCEPSSVVCTAIHAVVMARYPIATISRDEAAIGSVCDITRDGEERVIGWKIPKCYSIPGATFRNKKSF